MRNILMIAMFVFVCGNCRAVILVDQNTRNGSFETGQWDPWTCGGILVNDASFASDGLYYAEIEARNMRDGISQHYLSIDKNMGSVFTFQVDVRNGVNPFSKLNVGIYGKTYDGRFVNASQNLFAIPMQAENAWVTFTGTSTFNAADWQQLDANKMYFDVEFSRNDWVSGELLQSYLDNVVLMQTPEPATIGLLGLGGLLLRRHS